MDVLRIRLVRLFDEAGPLLLFCHLHHVCDLQQAFPKVGPPSDDDDNDNAVAKARANKVESTPTPVPGTEHSTEDNFNVEYLKNLRLLDR